MKFHPIRSLLFCLIILFFVGCSHRTKVLLIENDDSVLSIRRAVVAIIGEPRIVSQNQREFHSKYYSLDKEDNFNPEKSKERAYTKVIILGARRPYDVEVRVIVEKNQGKKYEVESEHLEKSKKIAAEIKERLNQSRNNGNAIDDFRAF